MAQLLRGSAFITGAGSGMVTPCTPLPWNEQSQTSFKNEIVSKLANVEILLLEVDITSESSVDQALQTAAATFGRVDYAVNNAGISGPFAPTEHVAFSEWRRLLDVNLDGTWRCQRAELQQMMKQDLQEAGGVIVNVASILGLVGASSQTPAAAYSASKHALMGLTKTDARYYAKQGIRINAICPGQAAQHRDGIYQLTHDSYIETPLLRNLDDAMRQRLISRIPANRLGKPEEVGNAIVFLASHLSAFMYGQGLVVDGGQTCG
ncbi:hypothetical protein PV11_08458 [Exophiala sideris]|uniref:Uncharacterized protein n=1 Tax=Exophiala sideris TaxID=1016849 RepID=A0A0D1YJ49_9EURO|nr:hypothetical protein PV11_08458 [Exophiala sideris]